MRNAVEGADRQSACAVGDELLAASAHLTGRFIREGHGEDRIRGHAFDLEHPRDTMRQHAGLARTGACEHEIMFRGRGDRVTLSWIQGVEQVGYVHPCILPSPLRVIALLGLLSITMRGEAALRYALDYDTAAETMHVTLCADAAPQRHFVLDRGAERFLDGLTREHGGIEFTSRGWLARDWRDGECLRYMAAIGRIADNGASDLDLRLGSDLITTPTQWLLDSEHEGSAEVEVTLSTSVALSVPWEPLHSEGMARRFRIPSTPRSWAASVAIGRFAQREIVFGGRTLHIALLGVRDAETQAKLFVWIGDVSHAALGAFGRLPVADVQVLILPVGTQRRAVVFGQSQRGQGHGLVLMIDVSRPASEFRDDWTAVHEFSHLFHPYLGDDGRWLAEGLASYWQNVLRARIGLLTPEQAWEHLDAGFGRGRADTSMGTRLDRVSRGAFMRIYWAGAAYWLGADVELRRASGGAKSLDLAFDRFAKCCLETPREWVPRDFVRKLDALVDADVFMRRYDEAIAATAFPDLDPLYAVLGIAKHGHALRFDGTATVTVVRRSIMTPRN